MAASLAASRKLIERLLPNRAPSFEPSRPRSKIRRGRHYEDAEAAYEAAMANQEVEEERERRQAEGLEDSSSLHVLDESDLRELERKRQQKLKFDLIKEQIAIQQKRVDAEMDRMPDFNPAHDEMPTFRLSSGSTDPFDDSSLVEETRHQSRGPCVDISNSNGGEQLSPLGSPISGDAKHVPRRSARLSTVSDIEHVKHAELITSSTPIKDKKDREQDREDESTDPPVVAQSISAQSVSAQSVSAQSISAQSDLASTAETDQENQTPIEVDSVAEETPEEEEIRPKQSPKASPASVTKVKKTVEGKEKEKEREQAAADEIRSPVSKRSKGRGSTSSSATPPSPSPTIRPLSSSKFVGTPRPSGTPNVLLRSVLHKATMERVTRFAPTTPRVNSTLLIARAPPKSGTSRRTRASVFSGVVKDSMEPVPISYENDSTGESSANASDHNSNKTDDRTHSLSKSPSLEAAGRLPTNDASVADAHEVTSKSNGKAPENSTIARDWDADTSMFTTGTPGSRGRVSTSPANSPSLDDSFGDMSLPSASFIARRPSLFEEPIVRVTAANKKKGRDSPVMVLMKPKLKLPENAPGLRRSQRVKVPRLQSHLNQRVVYKTLADGTREVASILDVVIKDKEMKKLRTADPVVMADERQRHQRVVKQRAEQKLAHDPKAQMRAEKKKTLRQKHKRGFDLSHSSDEALAHSLDQVSLLDDED